MKKLLIIAAVLILAGIFIAGLGILRIDFDWSRLDSQTYETEEYIFEDEVLNLQLYEDSGYINVLPSEDGVVRIVCSVGEGERYEISLEDGLLRVEKQTEPGKKLRLFGFGEGSGMTVYIPDAEYESLIAECSSGDIDAAGVNAASIAVRASSGSICMSGCTADTIDAAATSGSIRLVSCNGGSINAALSSGSIRLDDIAGTDISAAVTSGSIRAAVIRADNVRMSTSSGSVRITDVSAAGELAITATSGSVRFEAADAGSIYVRTTSGSVKGSVIGPMDYDASATSGSVDVPASTRGAGVCKAETTSGSIKITEE